MATRQVQGGWLSAEGPKLCKQPTLIFFMLQLSSASSINETWP